MAKLVNDAGVTDPIPQVMGAICENNITALCDLLRKSKQDDINEKIVDRDLLEACLRYGETPLAFASCLGRLEAAKALLDMGANVHGRSEPELTH